MLYLLKKILITARRYPVVIKMAATILASFGNYMETDINRAFVSFVDSNDEQNLSNLRKDIIYCKLMYRMSPSEYFLFNFQNKRKNIEGYFIPSA